MPAIFGVVSMLQTALSVVGTFSGNAQVAKTTGYVQDAARLVGALTPLVTQFANGIDITESDVKQALAGMHKALDEFDKLIAAS